MKYEEPKVEIILLSDMEDVTTLSIGETDPSIGEEWWS